MAGVVGRGERLFVQLFPKTIDPGESGCYDAIELGGISYHS